MTSATSQDPQDQLPDWVSKVRAIAIDTNAAGKGSYNDEQLRELARQAEQHGGLQLWIAEPVVWEWADHLREHRDNFNQIRSKLKSAGIERDAQPAEIDDALKFVRDGISAMGQHVKIVSIEPVAVEALKVNLQQAKDDLLEGHVPGPLTSTRLVEVAGVKRHRLTHDNSDINDEFQRRARALNRTKPEVDRLRANLDAERHRNKRLVAEREALDQRLKAYATALLSLLDERDKLLETLSSGNNVTALEPPFGIARD